MSVVIPPQGGASEPEAGLPLVVPNWVDRGKRWVGILAAYFSTQTVTQLAGIVAGLLLINFMPVQEYALYTLAMSVVAFFTFATDLGATSSLLYFSRESKQAGEPFEPFVAALLSLRRAVFAGGTLAVLVAFPFLATRKGFGTPPALLAAVAIVLTVGFQITGSVRVLVLRLADRYGRSYRAELAAGVTRLGVVAVLITASLLFAWTGVLGNALAAGSLALVAGSAVVSRAPAIGLAPYRRKIVRYLLPTIPSALYYSIQGPLVVWLAAAFGGTRNIAEVGALGRLGLIVGLFSGLGGVVFLPRLASVTDDRVYFRRFTQFCIVLTLVGIGFVALAASVPDVFLLLIGPRYRGLHAELVLVVTAAALTLVGGYLVAVNTARSWTRLQPFMTMLTVCTQLVLILTMSLADTSSVLRFGLVTGAVNLLGQIAVSGIGFLRPRAVLWRP